MRTSSIRAALDTNVLVSAALFPNSLPREVLDFVSEYGVIVASADTLDELASVLIRSRFDRYRNLEVRRGFLNALVLDSEVVTVTHSITACRDPKDDKFLELAVSGNATHVVSGDRDLLALHPFRGISIVSPHDFLREARGLV